MSGADLVGLALVVFLFGCCAGYTFGYLDGREARR